MNFTNSLKKNFEFKSVYKKGKSLANKNLVIYIMPNGKDTNNLGLSVSKKVGKSVIRSKVTRRIKESYRLKEGNVKRGYDIVVIARVNSSEVDYHEIEKSLIYLLKKHGIYN